MTLQLERGDCNAVRFAHERVGGLPVELDEMANFNAYATANNLIDMCAKGESVSGICAYQTKEMNPFLNTQIHSRDLASRVEVDFVLFLSPVIRWLMGFPVMLSLLLFRYLEEC
ncbi:hypothetical protein LguiB_017317 [Lonicera macranthoides]